MKVLTIFNLWTESRISERFRQDLQQHIDIKCEVRFESRQFELHNKDMTTTSGCFFNPTIIPLCSTL